MPVDANGVGYGDFTDLKYQHFAQILSMHVEIVKAVLRKYPDWLNPIYSYIDGTAGPGVFDNYMGSPLIFLETAHNAQLPYAADFIEININSAVQLAHHLPEHAGRSVKIHCQDYVEFIDGLDVVGNQLGLLFIDPSGEPPDFRALGKFAKLRPRMEILLYLSATNLKRVKQYRSYANLSECLNRVGKRNWYVRKPLRNDKHQWTFLMGTGTNKVVLEIKRIGFYDWKSDEAERFWERLNYSKAEREKAVQPYLTGLIENTSKSLDTEKPEKE